MSTFRLYNLPDQEVELFKNNIGVTFSSNFIIPNYHHFNFKYK